MLYQTKITTLKAIVMVCVLAYLAGCAQTPQQALIEVNQSHFATFPNWYHPRLGVQLNGENQYTGYGPLDTLLQQADERFWQDDLQSCLILLERAQRIATRNAAVYMRLSYLLWVMDKPAQAEQTARRALSVSLLDDPARKEALFLLNAIAKHKTQP